jgi:hypothetical protein
MLEALNLFTGGGIVPWNLVADDFFLSAFFGGITAAGTMLLAQRNEAAHPVTVEELLDRMERESLDGGPTAQYQNAQRERSVERP